MKTKLEVVKTVVETIRFSFVNIPTALRLGWLGIFLAIALLAAFFAFGFSAMGGMEFIETMEALDNSDPEPEVVLGIIGAVFGFYFSLFLWIILACLLIVPFVVVMKQIAAGTIEAPGGIAYFRFGGRELRYIVANILMYIFEKIVAFLLFAPAFIVFFFGLFGALDPEVLELISSDPDAFEGAVESSIGNGEGLMQALGLAMLTGLVGLVLYVWFAVRFSLFTTASAIENNLAPFGAVSLTGGNFWRIVGAHVLLWLIILAAEIVLFIVMAVIGGMFGAAIIPFIGDGGGAAGIGILFAVLFAIIYFALIIFGITLQISFPAKIYASLTRNEGGLEADETPLDDTASLIEQLDDEPR